MGRIWFCRTNFWQSVEGCLFVSLIAAVNRHQDNFFLPSLRADAFVPQLG